MVDPFRGQRSAGLVCPGCDRQVEVADAELLPTGQWACRFCAGLGRHEAQVEALAHAEPGPKFRWNRVAASGFGAFCGLAFLAVLAFADGSPLGVGLLLAALAGSPFAAIVAFARGRRDIALGLVLALGAVVLFVLLVLLDGLG